MAVVFLEGGPVANTNVNGEHQPPSWTGRRVCQFAHCRTQRLIDIKHKSLLNFDFFAPCDTERLNITKNNYQKITMTTVKLTSSAACEKRWPDNSQAGASHPANRDICERHHPRPAAQSSRLVEGDHGGFENFLWTAGRGDPGCVKTRTRTKREERYSSDRQSQPRAQHDRMTSGPRAEQPSASSTTIRVFTQPGP
jgi:hypothetical protein